MKLKKILCICVVLIVAVSAVACGKKNNAEVVTETETVTQNSFPQDDRSQWVVVEEDLVWEGYQELPFDEYLKKGIPAVFAESGEMKKCAVIAHQGWNAEGLLDESTVAAGNKAVTFVADTIMVIDGADTIVGFKFYMEQTPDNKLIAVAFERYQEGAEWGDVYEKAETEEMLTDLKEYM